MELENQFYMVAVSAVASYLVLNGFVGRVIFYLVKLVDLVGLAMATIVANIYFWRYTLYRWIYTEQSWDSYKHSMGLLDQSP